MPIPVNLTSLLEQSRKGDRAAREQAYVISYSELHRIARTHLKKESIARILRPTELVNESYLRLAKASEIKYRNREHFFNLASRLMGRTLIDLARARKAVKRDRIQVPMDRVSSLDATDFRRSEDACHLDLVLQELERLNPDLHALVCLRIFSSCTKEETAERLGKTEWAVRKEWSYAKAWLLLRMQDRKHALKQSSNSF